MGEVQELLPHAADDRPPHLPLSWHGSAGDGGHLANTVETGDSVLVAVKGYFGLPPGGHAQRYGRGSPAIEVVERLGAIDPPGADEGP